jgi:ATP-binding cassette subfamily B protein
MNWVSLNRAVQLGGKPRGWWSLFITGILSALIVPMMVFVLGAITDLFATRGSIEIPAAESKEAAAWAGDADAEVDGSVKYEKKGLLPLVYRHRDDPVIGSMLTGRYGSSGWMRSNLGSLIVLLLFGTLLAALESLTLGLFFLNVRRAAVDVGSRLRGAVYDQAFRLGVFDILGDRVTQAERLISEQIPRVEEGLIHLWCVVARSVALVVVALLLILLANIWLSLVTLLFAVLAWMLYCWLTQRTVNQIRLCEDRASLELDRLLEQLRQAPLVAGYLLSRIPGEPLEDTLRRFRQQTGLAAASSVLVGPVLHLFLMAGGALILALVGVNLFREPPQITLAATVVLGTSLVVAFAPVRRILRLRQSLPEAERSAASIFTYLDREPSVGEAPAAKPLGRIRERIELQSVTLADRQGRKLLDDVTLTIPARAEIAIVSSDSSVPIALAGLLARFYNPAAGTILCDGQEMRTVTLQSLRQQVALVTGNDQLFTGTVSDNISCGEMRFTQAQIGDAAKQALAYDFIQKLPQGFATIVGQQGEQLDTGQAFQISLSRVALRDPSLLVVQEPRGEIDDDTAEGIREAIQRVTQDRTIILLPTRLETVRGADKVILLHQGKVAGEGTHTELIQASELYRHLTYVRFNQYRGQVDTD